MTTGEPHPPEPPNRRIPSRRCPISACPGKKAFVTGSSRGIGRAVALALAACRCRRRDQLQHRRRCRRGGLRAIRGMGRKAQSYAHNVALEAEVEAMCAEVKRDFGTIDILVNNAGINRDRTRSRS